MWYENERVFQRECTDKSLNETAFQRWGMKMKHCFKDGVRMFETLMCTEYIF